MTERESFEKYLRAKGLMDRSIKEYLYYFDRFKGKDHLSQEYLNEFLQAHNQHDIPRAFINNYLDYIMMTDKGMAHKIVTDMIKVPKITGRKKKRLPNVINIQQVYSIEAAMDNERNKLMLLVSFFCGLRRAEVLSIKPHDFKWEDWYKDRDNIGHLKVIGKGDKERIVIIPAWLMARIFKWIREVAVKRDNNPSNPIWGIKESTWKDALRKASNTAIGRPVNPHLLRHSAATMLRDNNWGLEEIRDFLGHDSITTTQIYTHVSRKQLDEKYSELMKSFQ